MQMFILKHFDIPEQPEKRLDLLGTSAPNIINPEDLLAIDKFILYKSKEPPNP
jgi:hypothetical protein